MIMAAPGAFFFEKAGLQTPGDTFHPPWHARPATHPLECSSGPFLGFTPVLLLVSPHLQAVVEQQEGEGKQKKKQREQRGFERCCDRWFHDARARFNKRGDHGRERIRRQGFMTEIAAQYGGKSRTWGLMNPT